jgi:hypothetical protein
MCGGEGVGLSKSRMWARTAWPTRVSLTSFFLHVAGVHLGAMRGALALRHSSSSSCDASRVRSELAMVPAAKQGWRPERLAVRHAHVPRDALEHAVTAPLRSMARVCGGQGMGWNARAKPQWLQVTTWQAARSIPVAAGVWALTPQRPEGGRSDERKSDQIHTA